MIKPVFILALIFYQTCYSQIEKPDIPQEASVMAPRVLANHLSKRLTLYFLYEGLKLNCFDNIEYIVINKGLLEKKPLNWKIKDNRGDFYLLTKR